MTTRRRKGGAVIFSMLLVVSVLVSSVAFAGTAAAQSRSADVVFVFDETGSMDTQAEALKNEVENVSEELEAEGIDARYGLVTYEDAGSTGIDQSLSDNPDDLKTALDGISTFGGTENASHGILTALDMDFRENSQKIIVVITDEDDDGTQTARDRALQRVDNEDACLVAVSPDWYSNDIEGDDELKTMAGAVDCGEWTDVNSESFTSVVTDLINVIKEETTRSVEREGSYPDFEVTSKSLSNTTVYTDETFMANVVVENEGSAGGTYHALITDMDQVHYSERVDIGAGETHTFKVPLSYAITDQYRLRFNYRSLDYVTVKERPLNDENVAVTDGRVKRSVVVPNETYDVAATVKNVGNKSGYATVPFSAGEDRNNTSHVVDKTVDLSPGETATVVHEATLSNSTNTTWTADGTVLGNVSAPPANSSDIGVDAYTTPSSVAPGEAFEVTGVVYNTGTESQMATINFSPDNGQPNGMHMVSVAPGESLEITKTVSAPRDTNATSQTWWINGESTTVSVAEE